MGKHTVATITNGGETREKEEKKKECSTKLPSANDRPKAGGVPKIYNFNGHPEDSP